MPKNKLSAQVNETPPAKLSASPRDALQAKINIALERALVNIEKAIPFHAIEDSLLSD
jgi:hypothetical protein